MTDDNTLTIKQTLEKIGLSPNESEVYVAALKLGHTEISAIAKKAGVTRTNCYDVLKRLSKRGLVYFYLKNKTKHVRVAHPDKLLEIAEQQTQTLTQAQHQIASALPALASYFRQEGQSPRIVTFEGITSFIDMYTYLYKDGQYPDEALELNAWNKDAAEWFPEQRAKHRDMRKKKKIWVNQIVVESPFTKDWAKDAVSKQEFKRTRLIKGDIFDLGANVEIFGDKVAISNFGNKPEENQGVLIEGKEIATLLSRIFWLAWEQAKP